MIEICKDCARLRDMPMPQIQHLNKCSLCDSKTMCASFPPTALKAPVFSFERGLFVSDDLSKSLALIKSRKAILLPRIKSIQIELSRPAKEVKMEQGMYLINELVDEGLQKKSLNTSQKVFLRMKSITSCYENSNRATLRVIEQNLMAELSGLNEKEKELAILYGNCIDKILILELRKEVGTDKFNKVYDRSKKIYDNKNGK